MKRVLLVCIVFLFLTGCKSRDSALDMILSFRENVTNSKVSFEAEITADYGDEFYSFSMDCIIDENGDMSFSVTEPETIRGISGTIDDHGGNLTFDDKILAFKTIGDGRITPVTGPFVLTKALRGGYISAVSHTSDGVCAEIDDSYANDALNLQIHFCDSIPVYGEIFWDQRRVLTLQIEEFQVMQQTVNHCIG